MKFYITNITIYYSDTAFIGRFYYTDKNIMLTYKYIKIYMAYIISIKGAGYEKNYYYYI